MTDWVLLWPELAVSAAALALLMVEAAYRGEPRRLTTWIALGGIGTPAFQALATRQVDAASQGQLQGVLASAVSLASVIAPLVFSTFYFLVQKEWPGAIWLLVVAVYATAVPLAFLGTRSARGALSLLTARRAS